MSDQQPGDHVADEENIAVEHAADRLAERFPEVDREHIEEHDTFEGAPVRDFVPVLVEHDVKQKLAEELSDDRT